MNKTMMAGEALYDSLLWMLDDYWAESKSEAVSAIIERLGRKGFVIVSRELVERTVEWADSAAMNAAPDRWSGFDEDDAPYLLKNSLPEPPK